MSGGFHTIFTARVGQLAEKVRNGSTTRLFLVLPEYLAYDQFRRLNQVEVGKRLNLDNSNISRALAELLSLGVVERKGKGPYTMWRLSLDFGWRGDVDQYHAEKEARAQEKAGRGPRALIAAEGILWKALS